MNKLVKCLLVAGASMVAANSAVADMMNDFCPYAGIDYKQTWMKERHFASGNNNKNASLYGFSVYLGSRWDCFGLEAGLDFAGRNKRTITFNDGSSASTRVDKWGGYLDALAYVPVADCLEVLGGFGVGVYSPRVRYTSATGTTAQTANTIGSGGSKAAAVARLRLGLNYMVSECVGIRGILGWESTENLAVRAGGISRYHPFANSFTAQAGVFFKF